MATTKPSYANNDSVTNVLIYKQHAATLKGIALDLRKQTGVYLSIASLLNGAFNNGGMDSVRNYASKVKASLTT